MSFEKMPVQENPEDKRMGPEEAHEEANMLRAIAGVEPGKGIEHEIGRGKKKRIEYREVTKEDYENAAAELETLMAEAESENGLHKIMMKATARGGGEFAALISIFPNALEVAADFLSSKVNPSYSRKMMKEQLHKHYEEMAAKYKDRREFARRIGGGAQGELNELRGEGEEFGRKEKESEE